MSDWRPSPRAQSLLLSPSESYVESSGQKWPAIGTGIIPIVGTARSAKTTLALVLMEWVVDNTDRPLAFVGMPPSYLEALPKRMRDRATNPTINQIAELRDAVVLLDDTAVILNARDSSNKRNRTLNRMAGVISHLGLTLILTSQSMAGVDIGLVRFTELAPLVKRIDPMALKVERDAWHEPLDLAQYSLRTVDYDRAFYYSIGDEMLCKSPYPAWVKDDRLSRPYRYLSQKQIDTLVGGRNPARWCDDEEE